MKNNEILAIHRDFLETYATSVARIEAIDFKAEIPSGERNAFSPYNVEESVLYIPVSGSLVNWPVAFSLGGVATSYDYIMETFVEGMNDASVSEIVLEIDSPGGAVTGCFEAVAIMKSYKKKKVTARTKTYAASAAYLISMVADEILAQESATVGSIGTMVVHASQEKRLQKEGIEVTVITSGYKKAAGNPYKDLSEDEVATIQKKIDSLAKKFAQVVSATRGIPVESILALEGEAMTAEEGIKIGLVDKISLVNDKVLSYTDKNQKKEISIMDPQNNQPQIDVAALQREAAAAAQARIQGILNSEEAKGREDLAKTMAFTTEVSVEQAAALLKAAPKAQQQTANYEALMLGTQNPEAGVGKDDGHQQPTVLELKNTWKEILFGKGV
jgi:signal peptide peptidase SppA